MQNFGNIIYKTDTKAYIIKDGTYTVPHPGDTTVPVQIHEEFDALYAEIDEYAKLNPDKVSAYVPHEPTPEEIDYAELQKAKQERAEAVSNITVEIDGMVFDGDEVSQERMSRTITAAKATGEEDTAITTWVLHDNTIAQPTISQLARALRAAGEEQTKLWTVPYEDKVEDSTENTEAVAA